MKIIIKRFLVILNIYRVFPIWLMIMSCEEKTRNEIELEMRYWEKLAKMDEPSSFLLLGRLLLDYREYRNLIQHRLRYLSGGVLEVYSC